MGASELWMMRAETPTQFATALRWFHVPVWIIIVSLMGFVLVHLRAGRRWLAWIVCILRTFSLLLNFLVGQNLNYLEVTRLRSIHFLGESVSVAEGVSNPCMFIGQLSLLLFLVFVIDAIISVWRRGDSRQALVIGGSILSFVLTAIVMGVLVVWQIVIFPLTLSIFFLGFIVVMGVEMSRSTLQVVQLSDELSQRTDWLDLAADSAGVGIWLWDFKTNHIWGTERARTLYGFSPDEPIPFEKYLSRLHPDDLNWVVQASQACIKDGTDFRDDYRIVLPDGSLRWMRVTAKTFLVSADSIPDRMTGISVDITEYKESQLKQQKEQEFTNTLLEGLPGIFYLYTLPDLRLVRWNKNHEKLTGFSSEEMYGKHVLDWFAPADYPAIAHAVEVVEEQGNVSMELEILKKDGRSLPLQATGIFFSDGKGEYLMGIGMDITRRKQMELELQQKRNELTHVTRVSMIGELASTLAHELNQPLGAILRNAEAVELMLEDQSPDIGELRDIMQDIRKDDKRAGEVIDRMRAMMKKREAPQRHIDLKLLVDEALVLVQPDAKKRKVRLVLDVNPRLPLIYGDQVQLQQVFINLLLNAFDALGDNPPEIPLVTVLVQPVGETVEVAVSDNGPGIEPDNIAHLFKPFFSTKSDGLGMGLAISRGIIEAHSGRLWAKNNKAGGATFTITLPMAGRGVA